MLLSDLIAPEAPMSSPLFRVATHVRSASLALIICTVPRPAQACGGFFCDNIDPVDQSAERILFRINDDGTITTVVEIQYRGQPEDFAWVLPIPEAIASDAVTVAPEGLFDALEQQTGPVFHRQSDGDAALADTAPSGCDSGCGGGGYDEGGFEDFEPDVSGVDVVGRAVVGPYAIEIITATHGTNLSNWLALNGYQIPQSAAEPMMHYIDKGSAFLGIKLRPTVPRGPIDALQFTFRSDEACIPLILTAIAALDDMEIVAYILASTRFAPKNYLDLDFDYGSVQFLDDLDDDSEESGDDETDENSDTGTGTSASSGEGNSSDGDSVLPPGSDSDTADAGDTGDTLTTADGSGSGTSTTADGSDSGTSAENKIDSWGQSPRESRARLTLVRARPIAAVASGETNYSSLLIEAIDRAGGLAWNTEFARPTAWMLEVDPDMSADLQMLLSTRDYLTRFRTYISPDEMRVDPTFQAAPHLDDVDNHHQVSGDDNRRRFGRAKSLAWFALPVALAGVRNRRRRRQNTRKRSQR